MLLVRAPLASLSLAGQEHGRTIPLPDIGRLPLKDFQPAALSVKKDVDAPRTSNSTMQRHVAYVRYRAYVIDALIDGHPNEA